jgi:hypothetical protein
MCAIRCKRFSLSVAQYETRNRPSNGGANHLYSQLKRIPYFRAKVQSFRESSRQRANSRRLCRLCGTVSGEVLQRKQRGSHAGLMLENLLRGNAWRRESNCNPTFFANRVVWRKVLKALSALGRLVRQAGFILCSAVGAAAAASGGQKWSDASISKNSCWQLIAAATEC